MEKNQIYSFRRTVPLIIIITIVYSDESLPINLPPTRLQTTYSFALPADVCKTEVFREGKHLMKCLPRLQVSICVHLRHKYQTKLLLNTHNRYWPCFYSPLDRGKYSLPYHTFFCGEKAYVAIWVKCLLNKIRSMLYLNTQDNWSTPEITKNLCKNN